MIPLWIATKLPTLWKFRKLIGYGLAVLAVLILAWRIAAWRDGYLKLGVAQKALVTEKASHEADLMEFARRTEQSEKDRAQLAMDLEAIRAKFANLPPPRILTRTVEVPIAPGQTTCPVPRINSDFRLHWNATATP